MLFISNTTEPSAFVIFVVRDDHSTDSHTSWPAVVNLLVIFIVRACFCSKSVFPVINVCLNQKTHVFPLKNDVCCGLPCFLLCFEAWLLN